MASTRMKPWPSLAPFGKTLPVRGGDLFYYDSGAGGKTTVALVHGLGDEADTWRHLFPALTGAGYRVIAPDLPGFGRSLWKGRISMRVHVQALLHVITASGAASGTKPAIFAGSSLGAGIAELAAAKRPELARGLILIDGCYPFAVRGAITGFFSQILPFAGKSWYRSFRRNHEAAWKSLYPYYHALDAMSDDDKHFLRERVIARVESSNQERGYFATVRSMNLLFLLGNAGKRAAAAQTRVLPKKIALLWGENDRVFPVERADLFRALRPDAAFSLIAGAGHLPHQEKPEAVAAEILRFL